MRCSFEIIIGLIEVFLLDFDLWNLIEGGASEVVIIIGSDYLLKVQDGIAEVIQFLQSLSFVEVCFAEGGWRLICSFSDLCELIEVLKCLLRHLHLKEEKPALHQSLSHSLWVNLNSSWEWHHGFVVVSNALQTVTLAQISKTIVLLQLNDRAEVTQCFFPLLLENVYLASGDVGFDVARIAQQGLRECTKGSLIVIDPSVSDREHDKHRLAIVRALLYEVTQVCDRLRRLATVEIGYCSVEESIEVCLVHIEALREHLDGFAILLFSKEDFSRFKILLTLKKLTLWHALWSLSTLLVDIARGNLREVSAAAVRDTSSSLI